MDDFLDFLGLYRSDVAKDATCLFRAICEQLFYTQAYYTDVKDSCIAYINRHRDIFENIIDDDLDAYLALLDRFQLWAGPLEMKALSLQYGIEFMVYSEIDQPPTKISCVDTGETITLAGFSRNRYDCVYTKPYLSTLAICQSIAYEVLYKDVFNLGDDVHVAVEKMLHDKDYSKQRKSTFTQLFRQSCVIEDDQATAKLPDEDSPLEIKKALSQGIPPFPYKVAKTLDPYIYRNVEFDIWNEEKKGSLKSEQYITPSLSPGVKCSVHLKNGKGNGCFTGHVQELLTEGRISVYIEELCKRCVVAESDIEVMSVPSYKAQTWQGGKTYRVYEDYNTKFDGDKRLKKKAWKKCGKDIVTSQLVPNSTSVCTEGPIPEQNNSRPKPVFNSQSSQQRTSPKHKYKYCSAPDSMRFYPNNGKSCEQNASTTERVPRPAGARNRDNESCSTIANTCPVPRPTVTIPPADQCVYNQGIGTQQGYSVIYGSSPISDYSPYKHDVVVADGLYPICDMLNCSVPREGYGSGPNVVPSAPLQIPRPSAGRIEDVPVMAYAYPPMYVVSEGPVPSSVSPYQNQLPVAGNEVIPGIPSVYFNTPPNTGMSPPLTQWVAGAGTPTNYAIPYNSYTYPPVSPDVVHFTSYLSPPWNTNQGYVTMPYVYQVQASPVAAPAVPQELAEPTTAE